VIENLSKFVVATPGRSVCDDNARVLEMIGRLRFLALATRRGIPGVSRRNTRMNPLLGLAIYCAAKTLSTFRGESFRFGIHPKFDKWVLGKMTAGDHILTSYGYANACMKFSRKTGGRTFLDGGNSHPANFWDILIEEHRLWGCKLPPVARHHYERSMECMELVDYVLSPSRHVTESFLSRGFSEDQILPNIYPVNLANFAPRATTRPANRPFTLICTGSLSLRKGTPYLLEAFRLIRKEIPDARLLLTDSIADSVERIVKDNSDLPIEWSPSLPHRELADRLRSADVFVLPSLEEGLARTALEALASGLPLIVTPNTGVNDFVVEGQSGSVVPIRDPAAIARAAIFWWDRIRSGEHDGRRSLISGDFVAFPAFSRSFLDVLRQAGVFTELAPPVRRRTSEIRVRPGVAPGASQRFVVATPGRNPQEIYAFALSQRGLLRRHFHGARNVNEQMSRDLITNNPLFGGFGFLSGKFLPRFQGESARFAMNPLFDSWVRRQLKGDEIVISSYGYLCDTFAWVRKRGGISILDAGNSHPLKFWESVEAEHKKWNCPLPPISRLQHERGIASVENADYAVAVSSFVAGSLTSRGFPADRVAVINRPINLRIFRTSPLPRPLGRPLTVVCTGSLSLRKGSPYLLEAARKLARRYPGFRLFLTNAIEEGIRPAMRQFADLPIDWAPVVPPHVLAARLRLADIFVLPSIEEGLARTALEAMSCGLPVVVTENTGVSDFVTHDVNGDVVPICDADAIVESVAKWWERLKGGYTCDTSELHKRVTYAAFETKLFNFLSSHKLLDPSESEKR